MLCCLLLFAFGALPAAFGNVSVHHEISFTAAQCFLSRLHSAGLVSYVLYLVLL